MAKFDYSQSYGRILGVAYSSVYRRLGKYIKEQKLPITPDQFRLLTHLWQQDGRSQQELAIATDRDRASVTRIIDLLERGKIIERRNDEADRRVFKIYLTRKGKELEAIAADCGKASIADALKGVSKEDLAICLAVLRKTIDNLR